LKTKKIKNNVTEKTAKPEKKERKKSGNVRAVSLYSPRVQQGRTVGMEEICLFISGRTSLNEGEIGNVLKELHEVFCFFMKAGQAVYLEDVGTFRLEVVMDGTFKIRYLPDTLIKSKINTPGWFIGDMKNKKMLGKTVDDLIARWNEEHPDDPVVK
jgi:hypothetical protein